MINQNHVFFISNYHGSSCDWHVWYVNCQIFEMLDASSACGLGCYDIKRPATTTNERVWHPPLTYLWHIYVHVMTDSSYEVLFLQSKLCVLCSYSRLSDVFEKEAHSKTVYRAFRSAFPEIILEQLPYQKTIIKWWRDHFEPFLSTVTVVGQCCCFILWQPGLPGSCTVWSVRLDSCLLLFSYFGRESIVLHTLLKGTVHGANLKYYLSSSGNSFSRPSVKRTVTLVHSPGSNGKET